MQKREDVADGLRPLDVTCADQHGVQDAAQRTARNETRAEQRAGTHFGLLGSACPALDQGTVFFAFSDGHVAAYDARDGSERWTPVDLSAEAEQAQGEAIRYLDVDTTPIPDDLVLIQLTVSNTRTVEKKKVLYRRIVENLTADPGLRPEDIFINLVEVLPENWSFGNGIAQYVADKN